VNALIEHVPSWVGWLGWLGMLVGYIMQRRALVSLQSRIQNVIHGNQNQVTNTVNQSLPASSGGGDSLLAQLSSWATIVGLLLTLLPLIKAWLTNSA